MTEPTQDEMVCMGAAALLARGAQVRDLLPAAAADALLAAAAMKLQTEEETHE